MMHLRIVASPELVDNVIELLRNEPGATNVVHFPGAVQEPSGDMILSDVVREGVGGILDSLRELGVHHTGSITLQDIDIEISDAADEADRQSRGSGSDAVLWDEVEQRTNDETTLSSSFLIFMSVATMIAGIGVLLDQPILIVGAMVVGPDFGPLAAVSVGIVRRRPRVILRSLLALVVGYGVGMVLAALLTLLLTAFGLVDKAMLESPRPLTDFIWEPNALSWVVGFLAGIAGVLSLTASKSGALIGVLISVTTVPAAANAAVALAYGVWPQVGGSLGQLALNLLAIITGGVLTLAAQRIILSRTTRGRREQSLTRMG